MSEKEKSQSWAIPAYLDPTQPPALRDELSTDVRELDNGAYTNTPAAHNDRCNQQEQLPVWNLRVATITVFVMFAVGPVLCAFGLMMRDDLSNDYDDYNCENNYIALASEPWDESIRIPLPGTGRYHSGCRLLFHWSKLLVATGSLSIFRPMLQAIPVFDPTHWTVKYSREGKIAKLHTPSRTYILRTVFSAVPAVLYLVCAFILGTSRFMTGPETTEEWYRPIYIVCLSLICVSFVMSLHQVMSTGVAAWHLRGYKKTRRGFRPAV